MGYPNTYGKELILDLHECDSERFTRKKLKKYFKRLCMLIEMKRCKLTWWDDKGVPKEERQTQAHTKGTSAVQFILTSNITIHTLEELNNVYINIFSCKYFNEEVVRDFSRDYFLGVVAQAVVIDRI